MTATILVIEDDHATRTCLVDFLAEEFTVIAAADGAKGLQMSQEALPDLIICDIDMPYLNGYQVLEQLRANIHTAEIPFIFLSAHSSPEKISHAAAMGADDYLIKPIRLMYLSEIIKSRLKKECDAGFSGGTDHNICSGNPSEQLWQYKFGCAAKKHLNSTLLKALDDLQNYSYIAANGLNQSS